MVSYIPFLGIAHTLPDISFCYEVWGTSFAGCLPRSRPRPVQSPMCRKKQLALSPSPSLELIMPVLQAIMSSRMRRHKLSRTD